MSRRMRRRRRSTASARFIFREPDFRYMMSALDEPSRSPLRAASTQLQWDPAELMGPSPRPLGSTTYISALKDPDHCLYPLFPLAISHRTPPVLKRSTLPKRSSPEPSAQTEPGPEAHRPTPARPRSVKPTMAVPLPLCVYPLDKSCPPPAYESMTLAGHDLERDNDGL